MRFSRKESEQMNDKQNKYRQIHQVETANIRWSTAKKAWILAIQVGNCARAKVKRGKFKWRQTK